MRIIFLLLIVGICLGCTNQEQEKTFQLKNRLKSVPIQSSLFDSLLLEIKLLPLRQRIDIYTEIASRDEVELDEVKRQKEIIVHCLSIAPKNKRKRILLTLIILNQKLYQCGLHNEAIEGLKLCEELENYSLSDKEREDIKGIKVLFMNQQGQFKESLPILYEFLDKHRKENDIILVINDLCAVANIFSRLGDLNKALEVYKEAYSLAISAKSEVLQMECLSPLLKLFCDMGLHTEALLYCRNLNIDSVALYIPSIYNEMYQCYLRIQKPDSARLFLNKMNNKNRGANSVLYYSYKANTYLIEQNEDSAALNLNKAMEIIKERRRLHPHYSLPLIIMPVYVSYASLLERNGKLKQADKAFQLVEPLMFDTITKSVWLKQKIDALYHYSSFCHSTHQYKKAASLLMYRDSILKVYYESKELRETKNWVERFELQEMTHAYETNKKELNNTSRIAAVSWVFVIVLVFILAIGIFIVSRIYRQKNNKILLLEKKLRELSKSQTVQTPKRTPLSAQEQLYQVAVKTVETQKMFLNETLTLDELAKLLNTNRTSLSACINKYSGSNFNQWINKYRIDYVKKHITSSSNLRQLSAEAGFKSYNTFCSTFKEHAGCTPSEFMREHKYDGY